MSPDRSADRGDPARERDRASAARAARAPRTVEPTSEASAPSRRQPQQARSQAKVDAVLDAADELIIEHGTEGLTTTTVAARAGVAVGSLYRYFDGVPALLEALAIRHTEQFQVRLAAELSGHRFRRKRDAANVSLDILIDYTRSHPAFLALWQGTPAVVSTQFDLHADAMLALVVRALVDDGLALEADPDLLREAQIQWATAAALILLAFRRDPDGDPVVLAHLRHLFTLDIVTDEVVDLDRDDALGPRSGPVRGGFDDLRPTSARATAEP